MVLLRLLNLVRVTLGNLPACISYPTAGVIGDVIYYFWPRGRRNLKKSIGAVLLKDINDPEVRTKARRAMRNYCKTIVDILRYAAPKEGVLERDIALTGTENLDSVLAEGKGAIIVGLHMGSLDLGIRALSSSGYPINAIVHNLKSSQVDQFVQQPRASKMKLVSAADGILKMLNILKQNEAIALMIDSPGHEKGVTVRLGNKSITVPTGTAAMALRTGAKIVPGNMIRIANSKFKVIIGKPIQFKSRGDLVEDARELTQQTVLALEEMARTYADQWYIFHSLIKDEIRSLEQVTGKVKEAKAVNS